MLLPLRTFVPLSLAFFSLASASAFAYEKSSTPTALRGVRFWTSSGGTRVAIETAGEVQYRSERLHNPERVFFDLHETKPQTSRRRLQTIPVGDSVLKQIRMAETQPGTIRVVFDLERDAEFSASQLSNPDRLIIEFRGNGGPAPTPAPDRMPRLTSAPPMPSPVPPAPSSQPEVKAFQPPPAAPAPRLVQTQSTPLKAAPELGVRAGLRELSVPKPVVTAPAPPPDAADAVAKILAERTITRDVVIPPTTSERSTTMRGATTTPRESTVAYSAKPTSRGDRSLTRVLGLKLGRVVIDPGHGGHDTGTNGPTGLTEKDLVLDVSRRLGALIEERMGSEVIFTRTDDTFIPLEQRPQIANEKRADLFLSIHANSSPLRAASGVETYYLNFTTSQDALDVAARENAGSQKGIHELRELLQKIAMKDKVEESREFAARIQTAMHQQALKNNPHSRDRGIKKAPFVVLIGASMPSVLAEIGFVSNPKDEALMKRPESRQKLAEALYKGLAQYAQTLSHFQVAQETPTRIARKGDE